MAIKNCIVCDREFDDEGFDYKEKCLPCFKKTTRQKASAPSSDVNWDEVAERNSDFRLRNGLKIAALEVAGELASHNVIPVSDIAKVAKAILAEYAKE